MGNQKLTARTSIESSTSDSLIHVVQDGVSYKQAKSSFLQNVSGYSADTNVSAIWTSGLSFNVSAGAYAITGKPYTSTSSVVILDASDATLDRIDLIVAIAPIFPATVGTVGFIKGIPATTTLVVPPDYDPTLVYVIKQVTVKAAAIIPFNTSNTTVFDEGSEWTVTYPTGYSLVSTDPYFGTNHIFALNVIPENKLTFTSPIILEGSNIDLLTFYVKPNTDSVFFGLNIRCLLNGVLVSDSWKLGENLSSSIYNKITVSKELLNLNGSFNQIQIYPLASGVTFNLDYIQVHTGSGSDNTNLNISQFVNDVPYGLDWSEFMTSTGTRLGGNVYTMIGDYDATDTGSVIAHDMLERAIFVGTTDGVSMLDYTAEWGSFSDNGLSWFNGTFNTNITHSIPTQNNNIEFPDASGTIALTSDIPTNADYVDLTTNQAVIAGNKTWKGAATFNATDNTSPNIYSLKSGGLFSGIYSENTSSATGMYSNNTAAGDGIASNGTTASTGFVYVGQNNNVNTFTVNKSGTVVANDFNLSALNTAPASATAAGTTGQIRVTATHIYVCTATNVWVRTALATW
jgi:hypothetical protein